MQCRKRMNATERINDDASTSAAGADEITQEDDEISSILIPDCVEIGCLRWSPSGADFKLCDTCKKSLDSDKVPTLSRWSRFVHPPKHYGLPTLDPISARLVSPRLSFMQKRRSRRH
ncbi:hypothetical protein TNCV_4510481 [Trichonephila clavipes]|nr:hypothetical protein TNCV_4510481 [Trichonephila clavipes]